MANFHSSTGALENLLIGLARGYWKEVRRLKKYAKARAERRGGDGLDEFIYRHVQLKERFVDSIVEGLGDYFPKYHKERLARQILDMIEEFKEQR